MNPGTQTTTNLPTLIDFPYYEVDKKVAATKEALANGATVIYEVSFIADNLFCAVDVLEETDNGYTLIEVKSSSSQKDEHIPDAAVQVHVLRECGLHVTRAEVMHLSKECRFPKLDNLFERTDVTEPVEAFLPEVPAEIDRQLRVLQGPCPEADIGLHCFEPRECPFMGRCWPQERTHIKKLQGVGPKKAAAFL